MSWFPIGPNLVFAPRDGNFKRLSRRNEFGRQGMVSNIAIDPTDPGTIYVVETPGSGGASAFRTTDNGNSWVCITDTLEQTYPSAGPLIPTSITVNPSNRATIYMGDNSGNFYVSNDQGDSWSAGTNVGFFGLFKLIVDPRTANVPATTVILAASNSGVYCSANGGTSWTNVLPGVATCLAAYMPPSGTDQYYAGVANDQAPGGTPAGVYGATNPTGPWTNLNSQGIGLPACVAGNFAEVLVDYCPLNPSRVYVWLANAGKTVGIYTTSSPLTSWTQITGGTPPDPGQVFYSYVFSVAPNSPGDGLNDILFFAGVNLYRSTNAGQTWQAEAPAIFHDDQHAFAFFPSIPLAGVIPTMYVGCDGGISMSDGACDPNFAFATTATYFDELDNYTDLGLRQTLNHGKQSSAVYQYNSDSGVSALGYIGCQDTGVAAGAGALGWRGIIDLDFSSIAIAQGSNSVIVWAYSFSYAETMIFFDKGEYAPNSKAVTLGVGGAAPVTGMSNFVAGLDKKCLAGLEVQETTTLSAAIIATGLQTATPSAMINIVAGMQVDIDSGTSIESVNVISTTATTFNANFSKTHFAGVAIQFWLNFVGRIDQSGVASQISQQMVDEVNIVAAHPTNADILYCGTLLQQRLLSTNSGSTADASTVWTEATAGRPTNLKISSIAIDGLGNVFVLLQTPVTVVGSPITTPLFQITGGTNWVPLGCSNLPTESQNYGKLVADPVQPNTLYASYGGHVYQLTLNAGTWNWQDISDNLPRQVILDLWIGNIGTGASPKVLLRAAIPTRGVWERDVTAGATPPAIALYVRDNTLDQGWLPRSPEGVPDPYNPGDTKSILYHYMCADIKVDAQVPGTASVAPYFQTDPESPPPITGVLFDELKDNSQNLPGSDQALIHVQVHNRSITPANNVSVWAIYCSAAAGLPALNKSPSMGNAFNFWSQFTGTGQVVPNLPADSPWHSVGSPQILSGIAAAAPKVASLNWTIPTLASGDPGHYCIAVFIHHAISPVNETSMDVDDITPRNRQVGQKNLQIGAPLPPGPKPLSGPPHLGQLEFVEFHNPNAAVREANLVIDLRGLPPQLSTSFELSHIDSMRPLPQSFTGVARTRKENPEDFIEGDGEECRCFENLSRELAGVERVRCDCEQHDKLPHLEPIVYEAEPSERVEIKGIRIPGYGFITAAINIRNTGQLKAGIKFQFQVQQIVKGAVVGGSVYVVRTAGTPELKPQKELQEEGSRSRLGYIPPWAQLHVAERQKRLGKSER